MVYCLRGLESFRTALRNTETTVPMLATSSIPVAGNLSEGLFGAPAISGTRAVFSAFAALLGTNLDERRYFAVADSTTASPSTPGMNFTIGNQDNFAGAQIEGETVVFRAFSGTNSSITGI
jgi:hypothetical protein